MDSINKASQSARKISCGTNNVDLMNGSSTDQESANEVSRTEVSTTGVSNKGASRTQVLTNGLGQSSTENKKQGQTKTKTKLVENKDEIPPYLVVPDDLPAYREVPGEDNWEVEEIIDYKNDLVNALFSYVPPPYLSLSTEIFGGLNFKEFYGFVKRKLNQI